MNVLETQSSTSIIIDSAFWAKYQTNGVSTFIFDATVVQSTDFSSFGGATTLISPMYARGNVVVTYDYIPEPATASMSILVIVAAVWIRRRFID
jgi:hypothetical protein